MILLDYIRYKHRLTGTKVGCREGDCGACTVLVGAIDATGEVSYRSIVSCLTPIGNVAGNHVVTIEGLNLKNGDLTPIQREIVNHGGTQCGACTPGFIVSLASFALNVNRFPLKLPTIKSSIDGNICRCTGYKSIDRACKAIIEELGEMQAKGGNNNFDALISHGFLPPYFRDIADKLVKIQQKDNGKYQPSQIIVAGGTDLFVQIPNTLQNESIFLLNHLQDFDTIEENGSYIKIGGLCTSTDIMQSKILQNYFPEIKYYFELIASTPIRNLSSIGGNIVNASPIADMVIYFLPFNPSIELYNLSTKRTRKLQLKDLYIGYKELNKTDEDIISWLNIEKPRNPKYHFEKISKRKILDIASVNSAIYLELDEDMRVTTAGISAGGVAPIPKYLEESSAFLLNKMLSTKLILELLPIVQREIQPISDVRGSKEYKRQLLQNIIIAHFLKLFPEMLSMEELLV